MSMSIFQNIFLPFLLLRAKKHCHSFFPSMNKMSKMDGPDVVKTILIKLEFLMNPGNPA
jgi:hypothetical protein